MHAHGLHVHPHIALPWPACHACCVYLAALNAAAAHGRDFRIRHCSGAMPAAWACPCASGDDNGDGATAEELVARLEADLKALETRRDYRPPPPPIVLTGPLHYTVDGTVDRIC